MSNAIEQGSQPSDREARAQKERWITAFVNVVVWELRPGSNRMAAVNAARDIWPASGHMPAGQAARAWHSAVN